MKTEWTMEMVLTAILTNALFTLAFVWFNPTSNPIEAFATICGAMIGGAIVGGFAAAFVGAFQKVYGGSS